MCKDFSVYILCTQGCQIPHHDCTRGPIPLSNFGTEKREEKIRMDFENPGFQILRWCSKRYRTLLETFAIDQWFQKLYARSKLGTRLLLSRWRNAYYPEPHEGIF